MLSLFAGEIETEIKDVEKEQLRRERGGYDPIITHGDRGFKPHFQLPPCLAAERRNWARGHSGPWAARSGSTGESAIYRANWADAAW